MKSSVISSKSQHIAIPRGWIVLGLATASWMLALMLGTSLLQLFEFVSGSI